MVLSFKDYIFERIKKDNYRGWHLSQHNRLPFDKTLNILKTIYNIADNKSFKIHIGDWKGQSQKECKLYYKIVDELKNTIEQSTINSLKKNIFPDLHRMGFLDRYDSKNNIIPTNKRSTVVSVKLTDVAIELIHEKNPRIQYKQYISAVEKLLEPILDDLFLLLYTEFETINIYEYMFILSDTDIDYDTKKTLLKSYRKLKQTEKNNLINDIQNNFRKANTSAKNKKEKRDFGNWYNESLQIFNLLNQTVYFKTFKKTILMLSLSQEFIEKYNQRSQKEKDKYFEWHQIMKKENYELHHIVPISMATTKQQLELIDNHKNLIYISANIHKQIPDNTHIQLSFDNNKLFLKNPDKDDKIEITNECRFNIKHIKDMIAYNQQLLGKIN
ncbi:MAG: type IIS restriction endonuclease subunit R [Bacteroidia bacterium]